MSDPYLPTAASLVIAAGFSMSASALACSCNELSVEDRVRAASVIFIGEPIEVQSKGDWFITTFKVQEALKGDVLPEQRILHQMGTSCTIVFDEGSTLVFAHEVNGSLQHEGYCDLPSPGDSKEKIRRVVEQQTGEAKKEAP